MVDSKLQLDACSEEKLDALLLRPETEEEEDYPMAVSVERAISPYAQFRNLESFPQGEDGEVEYKKRYSDRISSIHLIGNRKVKGVKILGVNGTTVIEPEYDAIYAFANENLKIGHTYFLVEKDNKFGVFGVSED